MTWNRTVNNPKGYNQEPEGRATALNSIYIGFVKDNFDSQSMGRLRVWIPELGGNPTDSDQWITCSYASPFAGATSILDNTNGSTWQNTQRSYGWYAVPPDLDNEVLVCFINGEPSKGIWFACLYQQYMNRMVPGIPGTDKTQGMPIAEYNKLKEDTNVSTAEGPEYTPLADALRLQGLDKDEKRGTSNSGGRRYTPRNSAYGLLTPGGHQIVYDDNPDQKFIRFRTQTGTQIYINDTDGFIYMNSGLGKSWIEIGADGDVQIYGSTDISIRSQGSLNLRGDIDVNIEAGRSVFINARGENNFGTIGANQQSSNDTSNGAIQTATTTNTSSYPPISATDTNVIITVPTSAITGTFVSGMDIQGIIPSPATLGSVGGNSSTTTLNVNFSAGTADPGSNASVIIGTLQGDTTNAEVSADNNNTTYAGRVLIHSSTELHMTSGQGMWLQAGSSMNRSAGPNMFDTAGGSYDLGAGGYLAIGSNGAFSLGSAKRFYISAERVDINGDQAQSPKSATAGKAPISSDKRDVQVVGDADFRFILRGSILSQMPTHEPYDGHASTTQGTDGYVEQGNVDLRTGTIVANQEKPLDVIGQPNANSQPGKYTGQGFDSKGTPQYKFEGSSSSLNPSGSFQTSQAGLEFIAAKEGKKSNVYPDSAGNPTIGIGHKLKPNENSGNYVTIGGTNRPLTSPLSQQEMLDLFKQDLKYFEDQVRKAVTKPITQTQFDMLVSLCYNAGPGNIKKVCAKINAGEYDCSQEWMSINHIRKNGQLVEFAPLTARRREEYAYYSKGTPMNPATV